MGPALAMASRRVLSSPKAPLPPTQKQPTSLPTSLCFAVFFVRGVQKHCVLQGVVRVDQIKSFDDGEIKTVGFTRVVSVMRAARTYIIGLFLVMGPCQHKLRKMCPKMIQQTSPR